MVKGELKSAWKKKVKEIIKEEVEKKMKEEITTSRKLRFLGRKKGYETYLQDVFNEEAREGMKIRLNMVEWIAGNIGEKSPCPLCTLELDTTEHVFDCESSRNESGLSVRDLEEGRRMKEIVNLFRNNEHERREKLTNNILLKFDCFRREGTL